MGTYLFHLYYIQLLLGLLCDILFCSLNFIQVTQIKVLQTFLKTILNRYDEKTPRD